MACMGRYSEIDLEDGVNWRWNSQVGRGWIKVDIGFGMGGQRSR